MRYSRQNKILDLINNYEIDTQEKLVSMLRENGFDVTQATVSRDIKELQLIKILSASGKYKYAANAHKDMPTSERFSKIFRETITSFASSGNIIATKTLSGCGPATGEAIDTSGLPYIVGSIAGDNTIFLLIDSEEHVPEVMKKLQDMLSTKAVND